MHLAEAVFVIYVGVGLYLGLRVPENAVGWLLACFGLLLGSSSLLHAYAGTEAAGNQWAGWLYSILWLPAVIILTTAIPMLFPDGRLPDRRSGWILWSSALGWVLFTTGNVFSSRLLDEWGLQNPTASDIHESVEFLALLGFGLVILGIFAAVRATIERYRASTGVRRLQMKWFVVSASLLIPTFAVMGFSYEVVSREMAPAILMVGGLGIPAAIAAAVLRYRLYEIDRIISRTVTYTMVVGALAATYFAVAAVVSSSISGSPQFIATATLTVAAAFNPLRRRTQRWVDRRFNRSRYDAERVAHQFAGSLRDEIDPEAVVDGWVGAVSETMQPAAVGVWVR